MRFSYRAYERGDEVAINELYRHVTGRVRTNEQYAWQWLSSPAGDSEIWLIEAHSDDGNTRLIGHHGVMAQEFTCRGKQVRVGKTENTMVLPDFREKIMYPRFEQIFLKRYEAKFDALFSTMGPQSAIRVRKAMGYEARHSWVDMYWGAEPFVSMHLVLGRILHRDDSAAVNLNDAGPTTIGGTEVCFLSPEDLSFDFDGFWDAASNHYGLTPARTRANLNWRFWSNPYRKHYTLKLLDPSVGVGIAVVSLRGGHTLYVDDLYSDRPDKAARFLEQVKLWAKVKIGLGTVVSQTTSDCFDLFKSSGVKQDTWAHRLSRRNRPPATHWMPRKITSVGESRGLDSNDAWYVTPFFFEGR